MQPRLLLRICFSRRTLKIGCLLLLIAGATIFIADRVMVNASKQLTWSDVNAVPARNVGLLLGARPGNRYFTRRIDTAAALYHAGKVKWLLVSGDNGRKNYDEASGMQQALIAKGVPAKVIKSIPEDWERIHYQALKYKTLWTERYKLLPDAGGERYHGEQIV